MHILLRLLSIVTLLNTSTFVFVTAEEAVEAESSSSSTTAELQVHIYDGPTECNTEDTIVNGKHLTVFYRGVIDETSKTGIIGEQFDASMNYKFTIGEGTTIPGWETGLLGMCKGVRATLVVPPHMAYGEEGAGDGAIPGNATLKFFIEILSVDDKPRIEGVFPNFFANMDTNKDGKVSMEEASAYFKTIGHIVPEETFAEQDLDGDGFISWDEFTGPKGDGPPSPAKEEL